MLNPSNLICGLEPLGDALRRGHLLNYEIIKQREAAGKTFSFYIEGIAARPEVGKILEEIDQIRLGIAHKSGFEVFGMKEFPKEEEWKKRGANIVIYANQLMRAEVPAMRKAAEIILQNHRAEECDAMLMPFKEIIRMIPAEE